MERTKNSLLVPTILIWQSLQNFCADALRTYITITFLCSLQFRCLEQTNENKCTVFNPYTILFQIDDCCTNNCA